VLEGNAGLLSQFLAVKLGKSFVKTSYIGDDILDDIHASQQFNVGAQHAWEPIAVVNDLAYLDSSLAYGRNPLL
jgi:hypothetical protein